MSVWLALQPHFFEKILCVDSGAYRCQTVVWGILCQGDPVRRRRRYTIFTRLDCVVMAIDWTLDNLSSRFFHPRLYNGNVYFICTLEEIFQFMEHLAKTILLVVDQRTKFVDCISEGYRHRLEGVRKILRRMMVPFCRYIVNIGQTPKWCRCTEGNGVIPTLLTETSNLWSLHHQRLMHPRENFFSMGVPLSGDWGILCGLHDGSLDLDDADFMVGNMMHLKAAATCFCFVLFGSRRTGRLQSLSQVVNDDDCESSFDTDILLGAQAAKS